MTRAVELLLSAETVFTFAAVLIVWSIIGGPMRYMKRRYKWFMFFIAASLMGATLDKLARYAIIAESTVPAVVEAVIAHDNHDAAEVLALAKALILLMRILMVAQGLFILVMWNTQCLRVKTAMKARIAREEAVERIRAANQSHPVVTV